MRSLAGESETANTALTDAPVPGSVTLTSLTASADTLSLSLIVTVAVRVVTCVPGDSLASETP